MAEIIPSPGKSDEIKKLPPLGLFDVQNDARLTRAPKPWERIAKRGTAGRLKGRTLWKRYNVKIPSDRGGDVDTSRTSTEVRKNAQKPWVCPSQCLDTPDATARRKRRRLIILARSNGDLSSGASDDEVQWLTSKGSSLRAQLMQIKLDNGQLYLRSSPTKTPTTAHKMLSRPCTPASAFRFPSPSVFGYSQARKRSRALKSPRKLDVLRDTGDDTPFGPLASVPRLFSTAQEEWVTKSPKRKREDLGDEELGLDEPPKLPVVSDESRENAESQCEHDESSSETGSSEDDASSETLSPSKIYEEALVIFKEPPPEHSHATERSTESQEGIQSARSPATPSKRRRASNIGSRDSPLAAGTPMRALFLTPRKIAKAGGLERRLSRDRLSLDPNMLTDFFAFLENDQNREITFEDETSRESPEEDRAAVADSDQMCFAELVPNDSDTEEETDEEGEAEGEEDDEQQRTISPEASFEEQDETYTFEINQPTLKSPDRSSQDPDKGPSEDRSSPQKINPKLLLCAAQTSGDGDGDTLDLASLVPDAETTEEIAANNEQIAAAVEASESILEASVSKSVERSTEAEDAVTGRSESPGFVKADAHLTDDTDMLRGFLDRVMAGKAARSGGDVSMQTNVTSEVDTGLKQQDGRKPLGSLDANQPSSPARSGVVVSAMGSPQKGKSRKSMEKWSDETSTSNKAAKETQTPTGVRRSKRTRPDTPSRSKNTTASLSASALRSNGAEITTLNGGSGSIPSELSALTRANTRRNRGKPCSAVIQNLEKSSVQASPTAAAQKESAKNVLWDEQLVYFQREEKITSENITGGSKTRRTRTAIPVARQRAQQGNGTPAAKSRTRRATTATIMA